MTKSFNEIVEDIKQAYMDNYTADDSNEQVTSWINDTYPEVKVSVKNELMDSETSADELEDKGIIKFDNADELEDSEFSLDGDEWMVC